IAIDVSQRAFTARSRGEAGVVGELPCLPVKLADIDDIRTRSAFQDREAVFVCADRQLCLLIRQSASPCESVPVSRPPARRYAQGFPPVRGGPAHRKFLARLFAPSTPHAAAARACPDQDPAPRRKP